MSEFNIIEKYFTWNVSRYESPKLSDSSSEIIKSVGDDAAILSLADNQQLVTSIDTLVSGVHFPENTSAYDIAYKALAVNLSDLAAMGAKPEWFTLALTLTEIDHDWLADFTCGLKELAMNSRIALVGGDTSRGPLSISIQVMGSVEKNKALYRSGAELGDKIYVTGDLGDGAAGLLSLQNKLELSSPDARYCQNRLNRPTARLKQSKLIKPFASSCIDVSDGLLQDLSHVISASNSAKNTQSDDKKLTAMIDVSKIPLSSALKTIDTKQALRLALAGGDDYELLFTIPHKKEKDFLFAIADTEHKFTQIGEITHDSGIANIVNTDHEPLDYKGFDHFS